MLLTLDRTRQIFDTSQLDYSVMSLAGGITIMITERAARIFAFDEEGKSLYWMNPALANATDFEAFLNSNQWNFGGERIWIAPEIQYNIRDRYDFWNTHHIPADIDPGNYRLRAENSRVTLNQAMHLEAFNTASGMKDLNIERSIRQIENPLRYLSQYDDLMSDVHFAGYEHIVNLSEDNDTVMYTESWNLLQLEAGGILYIPVTSEPETAVYFGEAYSEALSADNACMRIPITGTQQFKVGYQSAMMTGRMAYLNDRDEQSTYLLVRSFDNNPSAVYSEEPPDHPDKRGFSVHVYNDDSKLGGFGEIECNGQAIGGDTGRTSSSDNFRMWIFTGNRQSLETIASILLGIAL